MYNNAYVLNVFSKKCYRRFNMKIASSTGEIDKRTINGNNGVKRGKDKKKRKRKTG